MNKKEFKEIWGICPTGKGDFWRKHHNRYLPETLKKWFNKHLDNLINSVKEECAELADDLIFDDMEEQYGGVPVNNIVFSIQARIAKAIRKEE